MTGHTPQKLPAFAAISCIIAVRAQYPYARSSIIPSFSPFVKDNFRIFYKISIEFLSISQNFLFAHSPFALLPSSFFPIPSSLFLLPYSLFPKIPPASIPPPKAPLARWDFAPIPGAKRLPCQRELAPEATEGFTVGTPPKYKPVWKGEGFLGNSEEGIGKKFRRLCLRNPPASAVPRHPPLARGASSLHPKGSLAKGSWQKSLIFD